MRINEFQTKITAQALNESAAAMFGQKLNLENFSIEQMHDARNKLRTKLSQFESREGYNAVHNNEGYSKNKMFLDVLNVAIEEREANSTDITFTETEQMVLQKVEEGLIEFSDLPEELQAKYYTMQESNDVTGTVLREGEEEKAELIMAARDMVDRITGWMEDTANMQAEAMLELVDSIRDELGADVAMEFESMVKPSLATIYTALESSRQALTGSVGLLTGEGGAPMMGEPTGEEGFGGDEMDMEEPSDEFSGDEMDTEEPSDEFAAGPAAAGGAEVAGRATRESVEYSRKVAQMLAPKKK